MKKLVGMMIVGLVLVALMFLFLDSAFETALAGYGGTPQPPPPPVVTEEPSTDGGGSAWDRDNRRTNGDGEKKRCDAYLYISGTGASTVTYKGDGTLCLVLPMPGAYNISVTPK